jgi:hypothetical protein
MKLQESSTSQVFDSYGWNLLPGPRNCYMSPTICSLRNILCLSRITQQERKERKLSSVRHKDQETEIIL